MTQQAAISRGMENISATRVEMPLRLNELRAQDARFITITVLDLGDTFEVVYQFERGGEVVNLRVRTPKGELISSITPVYPAALLAENELTDLFGIAISGISINFGGKLLKIEGASDDTLLKPAVGPSPLVTRLQARCREQCPGMVNAPKYVRQIATGDPVAAYSTVIERAPLPAILGRVCFAPCQEGCRQALNEEPIQIRLLKRYAADSMPSLRRDVKRKAKTGKKVAVVGGGPAGVSCAYYLGMLGHDVTLYERGDRCGGAMLWGIPKYRLPKDLLETEVRARLDEAGVALKTKKEIRSLKALQKDSDAVFLAIGAVASYNLGVPGEDTEGVMDFRELLSQVNVNDKTPKVGDRVAIIGGGNSSIDAARVSKRLGASKVTMYYRRTEKEMPASPQEINGALTEGVNFEYLTSPIKIEAGRPLKLTLQVMQLGEPDESGRRRPVPVPGSEYTVEVDTIVKAIGQSVVIPPDLGVEVSKQGRIVVDEETLKTSTPGVYAGGDVVYGPSSVIEATRDGRKAAHSIDIVLGGKGLPGPELDATEFVPRPTNMEDIKIMEKVECRELSPEERTSGFGEVELGFDKEEALREALRCWRCDWNE